MDVGIFSAFAGFSGDVLDFLMRQSLYAAVVAAVVWTVMAVVKPRHPLLHLTLWWFVLARLVLPADLAASWSLRSTAETLLAKTPDALGVATSVAAPVEAAAAAGPEAATGEAFALPAEAAAAAMSGGEVLPMILFLLWVGGVAAMALLLARAERSARHTIRMAEPAADPLPGQLAQAWARRFGVSRHVRVLVTEEATAPFTAGVVRPVIVLPRTLLDRLDPVEMSAVIGHEMSHIRSYDVLWRMAERVLLVLFFFHPMVWMAVRRIDTAREAACDISAATSGVVSRNTYAQSLLAALKAFRLTPEVAFARTLSIQGGTSDGLKTRLLWLKGETTMSTPAKIGGAAGILALGLMVLPMAEARQVVPDLDANTRAALPAPAAPAAPVAPKAPAAPAAPAAPKAVRAQAPAAPAAPARPKATRSSFEESMRQAIDSRLETAMVQPDADRVVLETPNGRDEVDGSIARSDQYPSAGRKGGDYSVADAGKGSGYRMSSSGDDFALSVTVDAKTIRRHTLIDVANSLRATAREMRANPKRFDPDGMGGFSYRNADGIRITVAGAIASAAAELEEAANRLERRVRRGEE